MSENYVQLMRGDKTEWLLLNYPNAFLLLTLIALRARRINGHPDGLIIGDAILGDPESAGLSRKEYRNAIDKLVEFGFIKIIHNGKKFIGSEKRAIKRAMKSMLVNLIDLSIYDTNPEYEGHQKGQLGANKGPTEGHKQERIIKKKNEEEEKENIKRKISESFNPDWAKALEIEDPSQKLHGTEIDRLVQKYAIPENKIRQWISKYSCSLILSAILTLESTNTDGLFIKLEETVRLDNVCYVVLSQVISLIEQFLTEKSPTKQKKKKEKTHPSDQGLQLARELQLSIVSWYETAKEPEKYDEWGIEIDRMMSIDGKEMDEIRSVINWLPQSEFWRKNVRSGEKLRKHFDRLCMEMQTTEKNSRAYVGGRKLTEYDNLF